MSHDINPVEVDRSEVCERQKLGRSEVVDSTEDAAQRRRRDNRETSRETSRNLDAFAELRNDVSPQYTSPP